MGLKFLYNDQLLEIEVRRDKELLHIANGKNESSFEVIDLGSGSIRLKSGEKTYALQTVRDKGQLHVIVENQIFTFGIPSGKDSDSFGGDHGTHGDKSKIHAPMPGKVVKVLVQPGDKVEPKQKLVIVEAMKMENPLVAPYGAEIIRVNCSTGQLVDSEMVLVELSPLA